MDIISFLYILRSENRQQQLLEIAGWQQCFAIYCTQGRKASKCTQFFYILLDIIQYYNIIKSNSNKNVQKSIQPITIIYILPHLNLQLGGAKKKKNRVTVNRGNKICSLMSLLIHLALNFKGSKFFAENAHEIARKVLQRSRIRCG